VTAAWLAVLVFALNGSGLEALATTSIPSLRHDRVLGSLPSTAIMRERVAARDVRLARAAALIGLTPTEYVRWRTQILSSAKPAYVEIPHHLDAMTGYSTRRGVYVIRDLDIPKSYGWEVDLDEPGRTLAIFLPADCGNLSLLKKPARLISAARTTPPATPPPTPPPTPEPTPVATPPPTPVPTPPPTPVPVAPPVAPVVHHLTILPYLGAALVGGIITILESHCTCPSPPAGYAYTSGYCKRLNR